VVAPEEGVVEMTLQELFDLKDGDSLVGFKFDLTPALTDDAEHPRPGHLEPWPFLCGHGIEHDHVI